MALIFTDVLAQLSSGQVVDDLNASLAEVTKAVEQSGKAGALTIKLTIAPNGDRMVTFETTITAKTPKATLGKTVFYTDDEGGVHRRDPRQHEMPLRSVGA